MKLIIISLAALCPLLATGQDAGDFVGTVLDLSRTTPGGSARILGMGGAQTALGGDISSASSNPAGLGFFNRSEFSFSPVFNYVGAEANYLDNTTNDSRLNFNFGNLGAVIKGNNGSDDFKGGSFGISINRVADFQQQITYEGNLTNDFDFIQFAVDNSFVDTSSGSPEANSDNAFAFLAATTLLTGAFPDENGNFFVDRDIYEVDDNGDLLLDENGSIIPAFANEDFPTFQSEEIESTGAMYQTSIAYGANYKDRLYFGGNIGILTLTREVSRTYTEIPTGTDLNNLILEDNYELNGTGVNASIGLIGRPVSSLLLAVSYTTPSFIAIEQIRTIALTANYFGFDPEFDEIPFEPFNYTLRTPSRLKLGATYFLGKSGLITADLEQVNYGGANLSNPESGVSFSQVNNDINRLESVWNYRLGTEFRHDIFRFRGGFSYSSDPIDNDLDESESRFSVGGGIRTKDYFGDLAIIASNGRNSSISPYEGQQATVKNQNVLVAFTVGFFF